jgi:excisionase family DNA binding protein
MKGSGVRVSPSALREVPANARNPRSAAIAPNAEGGPKGAPNGVKWGPIGSDRGPSGRPFSGGIFAPAATDSWMAQLSLPFSDLPPDHPAYLTIAEAADRTRCCQRTIRRAIDRGALRAGRVRGANGARGGYRIRAADLERWLFDDLGTAG